MHTYIQTDRQTGTHICSVCIYIHTHIYIDLFICDIHIRTLELCTHTHLFVAGQVDR